MSLNPSNTLDVSYLTKENRKLRMQLSEAIKLKQLHQQVLIEINQQYPQSSIIRTLVAIINNTDKQSHKNKLNEYIMQLEGRLMVLEKISQQTEQSEKETYNLLADEFQKLKQQNTKISQQLHKFYQKIGQVDYISGLVTKYKELILPSEQVMSFKKEQEQLLDALNLQQQMIKKLTQQRDKLMKINVFMKQEVQRKKDQVRNMTMMLIGGGDQHGVQLVGNVLDQLQDGDTLHNQTQQLTSHLHTPMSERSSISSRRANMSRLNSTSLLGSNNPNTTINFIKLQRQLLKDVKQQNDQNSSITNESDLTDCPQLSILFPDKVQKIIKTKEQAKVPYLNMKKVRQMMAKREQKMRKQWQQQKHHINPTTKIIQLQTELDITRKELANQSLKFRLMQDELKRLRLSIQQLQKRNQLLAQSNFRLKTNYQVVYKDYQLCKSITMQVQRALGMMVGRQNEHKVREKLALVLGNKTYNLQENTLNNQEENNNTLESTFRDQVRMRGLMDVFNNRSRHERRDWSV